MFPKPYIFYPKIIKYKSIYKNVRNYTNDISVSGEIKANKYHSKNTTLLVTLNVLHKSTTG